MNGVAKQFWSEIYDLRAPVGDELRRPHVSRPKKKAVRKSSTRRGTRRVA